VYTDVGEWWSGGKEQEKGERDQVEVARGVRWGAERVSVRC
jgi:hypothetical protein